MLAAMSSGSAHDTPEARRRSALLRITHWITVVAFFALLVTGCEIVISHPRFYWGEVGNDWTKAAFTLHIPASRDMVPSGYNYVLLDQNGWSRYLHFEAAWLAVITGVIYGIWGLWTGHFRRNLLPEKGTRSFGGYWQAFTKPFRRGAGTGDAGSYNVLQRTTYLFVIFVVFPMMIWTGLAMSPAFTAAFPDSVILLGGRQTARTLHFLLTIFLVLFVVVHVAMVAMSGFRSRMRGMITGRTAARKKNAPREAPSVAARVAHPVVSPLAEEKLL
jgi:thiosulfate reductase cytochrome b subunit